MQNTINSIDSRLEALTEKESSLNKMLDDVYPRIKGNSKVLELLELVSDCHKEATEIAAEQVAVSRSLYNEAVKNFEAMEKQYQELEDTLKEERTKNNEFFGSVCYELFINPRNGFQILMNYINQVETSTEITVQPWEWPFKLSLPARIHIALKLIFG